MNKTKIEWCDYTWNPVTGCLHGCEYCYARKVAERFKKAFPYGFMPTFHPTRLDEPQKLKKPSKIFVVSMGDLFGKWASDEEIEQVFEACIQAPQHKYIFLTKNPRSYLRLMRAGLDYRYYMWFGTTVTCGDDMDGVFELLKLPKQVNIFISIEPLLGKVDLNEYKLPIGKYLDWVIIGAETGNRKDKIIPKKEWVQRIINQCRQANVPVFLKDNLKWHERIQEFPEMLK